MNNQFWNDRYAQHESVYGVEPNAFFKDQLQSLIPGKLLLPAEGEGRNAIHAASLGWKVSAYDFSEVAKEKALKQAEAFGITSIEYDIRDHSTIQLPANEFDAIALIYVHLPVEMRTHLYNQCVKSLKPGGRLILEGFSKDQLQYNSGGPKEASLLHNLDDLTNYFSTMKMVVQEQVVITLNEGPFHEGPASVVRLVAIK